MATAPQQGQFSADPVIERMLPSCVTVGEAFADRTDVVLYPEESAAIARAVPSRLREFTTVRACARDALAALGEPPVPVVPGRGGAPGWPPGIVGSMTHCAGYRGAAVARSARLRSLGIDAERDEPLPDRVLEVIALPEERPAIAELEAAGVRADTVLFSAKEAFYKAWFPLTGSFLEFQDVCVVLRRDGSFCVDLRLDAEPPAWIRDFTGRWLVADGLVLTAGSVVTRRRDGPDRPDARERAR